jgi:hypothetical protein
MGEANVLPAAAFEAIAIAQATYGVPDRLIAKIAQCSDTQIARNRKLVGWSLRKVSLAYLRGQAPKALRNEQNIEESSNANAGFEQTGENNFEALRAAIERVLWRLTNVMTTQDHDELDPMMPKHIEAIGLAAKHLEKLLEMRSKANASAQDLQTNVQKDPLETARVLRKIDRRVQELAEQRARDIIAGTADGKRGDVGGQGMDDQRPVEPSGNEPA